MFLSAIPCIGANGNVFVSCSSGISFVQMFWQNVTMPWFKRKNVDAHAESRIIAGTESCRPLWT